MKQDFVKMVPLIFIFLILSASLTHLAEAEKPSLEIRLYTDKPSYLLGNKIKIYGYLSYNNSVVEDGIANLEIDSPLNDYPILFRTLSIGSSPSIQEAMEITSLFPCAPDGTPTTAFHKGEIAYFNVAVKNNNETTISYYLTLTCIDSAHGILDSSYISDSAILPHDITTFLVPFYITDRAPDGLTTVYANVFTKLPRNGGTTIAGEKTNTFLILGNTANIVNRRQAQTEILSDSQFYTDFALSLYQYPGNYKIYTSARYTNMTATAQTQIEARVPDVNQDGRINVLDLVQVASKLGWNNPSIVIPEDVNRDKRVNVLDLITVSRYLGWTSPP